jgi:putative ABC transport system substrate-binding protein
VKRRDFMGLLVGATAWPLALPAQQPERTRRIGVLLASDERETLAVFLQELQRLGWIDGRNVQIDTRWAAGDAERISTYAGELVALAPDVILATTSPSVAALQQATRTVPIVFVRAIDPVGAGLVASLAKPGRNATGFILFEYAVSAKWLELLKEVAPHVKRVAVVGDSAIAAGIGQFATIQVAAPSLGVELKSVEVRDTGEMERAIAAFAHEANGGLIVTANPAIVVGRELIVALAAKHKLPAVYFSRFFVTGGGLISYGANVVDQHRRAAGYVDRILKGEKPADLPVQAPTKYELVINLKTAKALGLIVPPTLLARADEVIE